MSILDLHPIVLPSIAGPLCIEFADAFDYAGVKGTLPFTLDGLAAFIALLFAAGDLKRYSESASARASLQQEG